MMRVVFMGTPHFAVPTLERLLGCATVVAVVTQPDRPAGRGGKLTAPPVKVLAQAQGLRVYQPEKLRRDEGVLSALAAAEADFFVVVAYGQILSKQVLAMPKSGCINVHGSILPRYRGAAPVQWAIFHGETQTGITTMLMEAGLDTGPMLLKRTIPITETITGPELLAELAPLGADLLVETLAQFTALTPITQDDALSTYAPLITPEVLPITWTRAVTAIHNQVRAFWPQVYTMHRKERLKILGTRVLTEAVEFVNPGTVVQILRNQGFVVQTGAGQLLITQVQPPGKKVQSAWDFVNGARLVLGERFEGL